MRRLTLRERLTAIRAAAVMTVVEFTVRWVPIPRLSRFLGTPLRLGPEVEPYDPAAIERLDARTRRQLECTQLVAAVWPFSDGPCLRESLTGGHLIRRLDPVLRLGVIASPEGSDVVAHAWLEVDGRPLEPITQLQPFADVPSRGES